MNLDLEAIQSWLQALPEDQDTLAAFGRGFLGFAIGLFATVCTWVLTRLGWAGLKLADRGARACWRSGPEAQAGWDLGQAVLASLRETTQPPSKEARASLRFGSGLIWLASGDVNLGGEAIHKLLPHRLHKRIWREAKGIAARLDREARSGKRKKVLEALRPSPAQNPPCAKEPPPAATPKCPSDWI